MSAALEMEKLVDKKELSTITGLSIRFIETAMKQHGLPFHKLGESVRYYPSEVAQWIASKKVEKS